MIKMRLQGSRNEIRWFLKVLEKDPRFDVEDTSEMFSIKTSNRYKRLYTNIYRKQISNASRNTKAIGLNQLATASIMPPENDFFLTIDRYMPHMAKHINGSSLNNDVLSP